MLPSASTSLAYRNNLLTWLGMQWLLSNAQPNRVANEERKAYLRLAETVVINLAAAGSEKQGEEKEVREQSWVSAAERLVERACDDAGKSQCHCVKVLELTLASKMWRD